MSAPATPEERRKILEMVASGKLSAGEAADLLPAAGASAATEGPETTTQATAKEEAHAAVAEEPAAPKEPAGALATAAATAPDAPQPPEVTTNGRWLNIRVEDMKSGRRRVAVKVPLRLVRFGLRLGSAFTPELERFDWDTLSTELAQGGGMLVDVQDDEDGERVQIFVE